MEPKAVRGRRFSMKASTFNEVLGLIDQAKANSADINVTPSLFDAKDGTVLVRNNSGENRNRFDILGMNGFLITPTNNSVLFQNQMFIDGVEPDIAVHTGKFLILQGPIENEKYGRALIFGAGQVKVNINNENDPYADVKDGDYTQLESGPAGAARIIAKESGTGTKWAYVRIGGTTPPVLLKAQADASGGSISVKYANSDGTVVGDAFDMDVLP